MHGYIIIGIRRYIHMHSKNNMLFIFVCIILMCSYVQFVYNIQCAVTCILACRTLALVFIEYSIQTAGLPPSLHGQHSYFEISWPIGEGERGVPLNHIWGHELFGVKGLRVHHHLSTINMLSALRTLIYTCVLIIHKFI